MVGLIERLSHSQVKTIHMR